MVLSPYLVTTTADSGPGSLRDAITQVNADTSHTLYTSPSNSNVDEIDFNITAASDTGGGYNATTGVATITLQTALPTIRNAVIVNGYSQVGAQANTLSQGDNAVLKIQLDEQNLATQYNPGFWFAGNNSTISGLVVNNLPSTAPNDLYGIYLSGTGDQVQGCFIGTDISGSSIVAGGPGTIGVEDANGGNLIGGTTPGSRNIIAGWGTGVNGNALVEGNYIGTDASGTTGLANQVGVDAGIVGGTAPGAGNLISGNNLGIATFGASIQGNLIGTDASGTSAVPYGTGIQLFGGLVGGTTTAARNIISGNSGWGIFDQADSSAHIEGNYIGTDITGTKALGNGTAGVVFWDSAETAGGTAPGAGNLISGNNIGVYFHAVSSCQIEGNQIVANGVGIYLPDANSNNNLIGGTLPGAGNTIAFNSEGVQLYGGTGNAVLGNAIYSNPYAPGIASNNGANDNQAGPVLTGLSGSVASPAISGSLTSAAYTTFRIEFFANPLPSNLANTEGQTLLGSVYVTTNASGKATFTASGLAAIPVTANYLTATATVATPSGNSYTYGDTSQFSAYQQVSYFFGGFQAPLSQGLNFALNRVIPIKFTLTDLTGAAVTSLAAVSSLQVAPVNSDGSLGTAFTPASTGNKGLTVNGSGYSLSWETKGLTAGSYAVVLTLADGTVQTRVIQLTKNGNLSGLTTVAAGGTGTAPGGLVGGNIILYVDNTNGDLTADELARIQNAVTAADAVTEPYGVAVTEVTDPTLADVTLNMDTTSAVGGYADGVLGCTTDAGQITVIQGWNFYGGSDATQIGSAQYDFETVVTHELGHALGLGHSTDSTSVMYATLNTGTVNRSLTTADLNVPDSDTTGACGLHAAAIPILPGEVSSNSLAMSIPGRDAFFSLVGAEPARSDGRQVLAAQLPIEAVHDSVLVSTSAEGMIADLSVRIGSPIFAAQPPRDDDNMLFDVPLFPDPTQDGLSDTTAPDGSHSQPSDARPDFNAADSAILDY
jgi:parallel beta-helix repeat protein